MYGVVEATVAFILSGDWSLTLAFQNCGPGTPFQTFGEDLSGLQQDEASQEESSESAETQSALKKFMKSHLNEEIVSGDIKLIFRNADVLEVPIDNALLVGSRDQEVRCRFILKETVPAFQRGSSGQIYLSEGTALETQSNQASEICANFGRNITGYSFSATDQIIFNLLEMSGNPITFDLSHPSMSFSRFMERNVGKEFGGTWGKLVIRDKGLIDIYGKYGYYSGNVLSYAKFNASFR